MGYIAGRENKTFELFLFNCITNKVFVNTVERLPLTKILQILEELTWELWIVIMDPECNLCSLLSLSQSRFKLQIV